MESGTTRAAAVAAAAVAAAAAAEAGPGKGGGGQEGSLAEQHHVGQAAVATAAGKRIKIDAATHRHAQPPTRRPTQLLQGRSAATLRTYRNRATGEISCVVSQLVRGVASGSSNKNGRALVEKNVGKLVFTLGKGRRWGHIKSVRVDTSHRGMGLGVVMLREAFATLGGVGAEEVRLEAEEDTRRHNRLIGYYERLGFQVKAGAKVQYLHHHDSTLRKVPMVKRLCPGGGYPGGGGEEDSREVNLYEFYRGSGDRDRDSAFTFGIMLFCSKGGRVIRPRQDGSFGQTLGDSVEVLENQPEQQGERGGGQEEECKQQEQGTSVDGHWVLQQQGEMVYFESVYGNFLCAEPDGRVTADRRWDSTWEAFCVQAHMCGRCRAATAPEEMTADGEGVGTEGMAADGPCGCTSLFLLRTSHGQYLCLDEEGGAITTTPNPAIWNIDTDRGVYTFVGLVSDEEGPLGGEEDGSGWEDSSRSQECQDLMVSVQQRQKRMCERQTVDYVRGKRTRYESDVAGGVCLNLSMWQALERLQDMRFPYCKLHVTVLELLLLTAQDLRDKGFPDWMQVVGLVHGMGALLSLTRHNGCQDTGMDTEGRGEAQDSEGGVGKDRSDGDGDSREQQAQESQPQQLVVQPQQRGSFERLREARENAFSESQWVVGAPFPEGIACREYHQLNSDCLHPLYSVPPLGMNCAGCGLDAVLLPWAGTEYLHAVLSNKRSSNHLPPEALSLVRYWPLELWHARGAYRELESDRDREVLGKVQQFDAVRRATVRSVSMCNPLGSSPPGSSPPGSSFPPSRQAPSVPQARAWLEPLVNKYLPGTFYW